MLSLLVWLLVALLLRWTVIEPRWIPSGSMLPTLQLEDRVLVEKVLPRLGLPLPAGTIVVFHPPTPLLEAGYDPGAALIKRVVAEHGDRVEVRQGRLWCNGVALREPWTPAPMGYRLAPWRCRPATCWSWGTTATPASIPISGVRWQRQR